MIPGSSRRVTAPALVLSPSPSALAACSNTGGATPSPSVGGSPGAAAGAACPTSQPPALAKGETRTVTIDTAKGSIAIKIEADLSPIAAGNFVALAGCGFYDGVVFHRVATLQDGTPFVIQGGDGSTRAARTSTRTGPAPAAPATRSRTSRSPRHTSEARWRWPGPPQPNSVGSQFFIVLDDKDQAVLASANTYQIIGSVTSGMDAVDAIYAAAGGQEQPANPVAMTKVTVSNP